MTDLHQEFKETLKRKKNGGESRAKGSHVTQEMPFMLEMEGELWSNDYTDTAGMPAQTEPEKGDELI